jgi:hypothetical protein
MTDAEHLMFDEEAAMKAAQERSVRIRAIF